MSLNGTITCLFPTEGTHLHSQCRPNATVPLIASKFSMLTCPGYKVRKEARTKALQRKQEKETIEGFDHVKGIFQRSRARLHIEKQYATA